MLAGRDSCSLLQPDYAPEPVERHADTELPDFYHRAFPEAMVE